MSNWNIKTRKNSKKKANKIKKSIDKQSKIRDEIGCNVATSRKKTEFTSEEDRKRMIQGFYS